MYFDRFDIIEAWYLWLSYNHEGQTSVNYRRLCNMDTYFSPRDSLSYETLSENAKEIYDNLSGNTKPYWRCEECGYENRTKAMPKDREKFYSLNKAYKCPKCKSESFIPVAW